jgi:hypothetical protein
MGFGPLSRPFSRLCGFARLPFDRKYMVKTP